MMKRNLLTGAAIALMALSACNDETLDIGSSLTGNTDKISISQSEFEVTTRSVLADSVLLRSSYCYLGRVKDVETRSYVKSEFMTQFNLLETFSLPLQDDIATTYEGMVAADSCHINLYYDDTVATADSLAAMKVRVSELAIPMEEDRHYYSNFDPVGEGLIRQDGIKKDKVFSYYDLTLSDSKRSDNTTLKTISFNLNQPYTDKSGKTYNNYGTYLMQQYYQHPEYFKNSYSFIHNVCPGFFFSVTDGEGVYTEIQEMGISFYFQRKTTKADSTSTFTVALAGTEEILQTTKITNDHEKLKELAADNTCTYIKAPAGLYTEVTLPIDDIFKGHETDTIMSAQIDFMRINDPNKDRDYGVPTYLMMVPKDSLNSFFENQKLPDNQLTYSSTFSTSRNEYSFTNLSAMVNRLASLKREGLKSDADWLGHHPNWNKVLLVPVQAITTTTSGTTTISSYEHSVNLATTKLVGGSESPDTPVKLTIVYGSFNQ